MEQVCERVQVDGGIVVGHDGSECAQQALQAVVTTVPDEMVLAAREPVPN